VGGVFLVLDFGCVLRCCLNDPNLGSFEVTCISMVFLMHCKENDGTK
jgi:hypothetical protein